MRGRGGWAAGTWGGGVDFYVFLFRCFIEVLLKFVFLLEYHRV